MEVTAGDLKDPPNEAAAADPKVPDGTESQTLTLPPPLVSHPSSDSEAPPPAAVQKSVSWSANLTSEAPPQPVNSYLSTATNTVETVKDVLGRWSRRVSDATRKGQDLAGDMWQHLKTGPSMTEAAMGRLAQGTKVLAEGGYEKIFSQTFEALPEEKLKTSYACYLSTSAGPVMGILYLSNAKLAFCSDNPLSYKVGDKTEWSYYKVVIPLVQLRTVSPLGSKENRAERYLQIVSIDNHEFWFMGFVNYDNAVAQLQEALQEVSISQP